MSTDETSNHRLVEVAAATSFALARLRLGPLNQYTENGDGFYYNSADFPRDEHTEGLLIRLGRFLAFLGKLLCLVMLSAVSYGIFYQNAMPAQHVLKELHFDYTSTSLGYHTASEVAPKRYPHIWPSDYGSQTSATPDMHRAVPTATLDLLAKHNEWRAYFVDVLPQPSPKLRRVLEAKQAYFIEVALTLPESQSNKYSGMFGVVTELYTGGHYDETSMGNNGTCLFNREPTLLAVSRRSYRFPHQSAWISVIGKVIILVPLLIGAFEEVKTVASPAFRHFIESSARPLVRDLMCNDRDVYRLYHSLLH
jgi:Putative adipose-regulatory protein (Seipin)